MTQAHWLTNIYTCSHACTHARTHTLCSATLCPIRHSWQQGHDGQKPSLRGSSFHLLSQDKTGATSLGGQGLWENCNCFKIRPIMHKPTVMVKSIDTQHYVSMQTHAHVHVQNTNEYTHAHTYTHVQLHTVHSNPADVPSGFHWEGTPSPSCTGGRMESITNWNIIVSSWHNHVHAHKAQVVNKVYAAAG